MGRLVKVLGGGSGGLGGGQHYVQQLVHPPVDHVLGEFPTVQGREHLPVAVPLGAGHLQVAPRFQAVHLAVAGPPVGDHNPIKSPLLPENFGEQVGIFVGVGSVHPVVGGHDPQGAALLHGDLKPGEVQLPECALVHHAVAGHAQQLLAVGGEVLDAGGRPLGLDAPHQGGGELAGQIGVLREVLKVPAPQGAALQVHPRPQEHVHPLGGGLPAQGAAHLLQQRRVPAPRQAGGGGEAGGRLAGPLAQMVPPAQLPPQAVGAVGHHHGGHPRLGKGVGAPHVLPREEGDFLLQCELFENVRVFHRALLLSWVKNHTAGFGGCKRNCTADSTDIIIAKKLRPVQAESIFL